MRAADSSLTTLFDELTKERIEQFANDGQEEHLTLEFKTVGNRPFSKREDRQNLAAALSGFANSSGGIVVWGVGTASGGSDDPDVANELVPVDGLIGALSKLNEFTASAVSPLVDGVVHRALAVDEDRGFLVSYVPESLRGPHMAKAGLDRYYKRSGDSFRKMEHFDIADMFGRRARPELVLTWRLVTRGGSSSSRERRNKGLIVLTLANVGRGSASAPFLMLDFESDHTLSKYGVTGNRDEGLPRRPHAENPQHFEFGADSLTVIHPGTEMDVAAIDVAVVRSAGELIPTQDVEFVYATAALDDRRKDGSVVVPAEHIVDVLGTPV